MSNSATSPTVHWAVLVGVNFYIGNEGEILSRRECLQGAVPDVLNMKQYLEAAPHPVDIALLTATPPTDLASTIPQENRELWPTRDNVAGKLKRVLKEAKKGDYVYIHFSGHGTKRPTTDTALDEFTDYHENLAIVLYEEKNGFRSYLDGENLARCLKKMVEQELLVTVVLDCCFSGSVLRTGHVIDAKVRVVDYNPAVERAFPPEFWNDALDLGDSYRHATVESEKWFVNPKGYAILSACGPNQVARELTLPSGERRGALSYFLVRALEDLRKRHIQITNESLYEHLRIRFQASWPTQVPVHYGNKGLSFFGKFRRSLDATFVPLYWKNNHLYLGAGEAHGVCKGDTYVAYPLGSVDGASIKIRVDVVGGLISEMVEHESAAAIQQIRDGWKAKPLNSLANRKIGIRLMPDAYDCIKKSYDLGQLRFIRLCVDNTDAETSMFNLILNNAQEYSIYDGSLNKLNGIPSMHISTPGAERDVANVLQHLASFKYFEGVENQKPNPSFEASFSLLPSTDDIEMGSAGLFNVKHGNSWYLTVKNHSKVPLYLALFLFTSSWTIFNLTSAKGGNSLEEIDPYDKEGRTKQIELKMTVPETLRRQGKACCEDIIKVFLTSKSTSFPSMNLGTVPIGKQDRGTAYGGTRGLEAFLASLTDSYRGGDDIEGESWATRNYIICTSL